MAAAGRLPVINPSDRAPTIVSGRESFVYTRRLPVSYDCYIMRVRTYTYTLERDLSTASDSAVWRCSADIIIHIYDNSLYRVAVWRIFVVVYIVYIARFHRPPQDLTVVRQGPPQKSIQNGHHGGSPHTHHIVFLK